MSQADTDRDPFFIGWFPMPRAYARVLAPVALGLVLAGAAAGGFIAWGQRSPGAGVWDDGTTTFTGIVYAEPYAMIRVPGAEAGRPPRTVLLVEEGKFGAKARVRPFDGRPVQVSGTLLTRNGPLMLELAAGDGGLRGAELPEGAQSALRRSAPRARGPVTLSGEIVDSKCYLGAMKPGAGRAHKGCARLCLLGGIPPVFVTDGEEGFYLITNPDGDPLDPRHFDRAGEPLRVSGEGEVWDDLRVLKLALPPG